MRNIIKLNEEIVKIFNPKIEFHREFKNISFNDKWISELGNGYLLNLEINLKEQILLISDGLNPKKISFLKILRQDILKRYEENLKIDFENLDSLKNLTEYIFHSTYPNNTKPKESCSHIDVSYDFSEYIYSVLLKLYNTDKDWAHYASGSTMDEIRDYINSDLIEKFVEIEGEDDEDSVEEFYAYTLLSLHLSELRYSISKIAKYLDDLIKLIDNIESFKDENLSFEEIYDNDPNNIKLEYRINKMEVAMFYRALHESGIIYVNNQNQKYPYTNLKKYLDNANIYYLENKNLEKINKINKEFTKIKNNEEKLKEINLLEFIITKLNSRKEDLLADKEEGIL